MAKQTKSKHNLLKSLGTTTNFNIMKSKQKRQFKNSIRKKNLSIFHFKTNNSFIYEPLYSSFFYNKLDDKNFIKFNKNEIIFLRI